MPHPLVCLAAALPLVLSSTALAQYAPRHDYGAPMEPAGGIVHGIGQDGRNIANHKDQRAGDYWERVSQPSTRPALYAVYLSSSGRNAEPVARYLDVMDQWDQRYGTALTPQAGVNLMRFVSALAASDAAEIAAAQAGLDEAIDLMNQSGRDWYVRPGYEFNGEWNDYDPDAFKRAWAWFDQRMAERATFEHALIWTYAPGALDTRYMPWYPGDEAVDWWGIDVFDPEDLTGPETATFLDDAHARGKPVMIGEASAKGTGTGDGGADWDAWFAPFFALMKSEPGIKGFQYINWDWTITQRWPGWGDARIENDPVITGYWNAELADPIFVHADVRSAKIIEPEDEAEAEPFPVPGRLYTLRNAQSGRYLDTDGNGGVDQHPSGQNADKQWRFEPAPQGFYLVNAKAGRGALDTSGNGRIRWTTSEAPSGDDKHWLVSKDTDGSVGIQNVRRGREALMADGPYSVRWGLPGQGGPAARWIAEPVR